MEPSQLNLEALVSLNKKDRKNIADCLLYALRTTYHYRISRKTIMQVLRSVRSTCIFLQTNPQMHRRLVQFAEKRLPLSSSKNCFVYPEYQGDPEDYLNEMKHTWYSGEDRTEHNESFYELLSDANVFSTEMLEALDNYLAWHGNRDDLSRIIGSRSYYTGEPC